MSRIYGSVNPNHQREHPLPVQHWLSENDPVHFILDAVTKLDISAITAKHQQQRFPPYSPRMMVALLVYSYFRGIFSSREIMQACQERLTFRAIVGDNIPNWRLISDFRKLHMKELEVLFLQVLKQCQRAGLVTLGHSGSGRTEVKPTAGRQKQEQRLQCVIHRLLSEAEAVDQQEDQRYVTGCGDEESPEHLAHQQRRLELIGRAKGALKTYAKDSVRQTRAGTKTAKWPRQRRKRTVILEVPPDSETRPPTWGEAALKCVEVYRQVISKHKNCRRR